MVLHDPPLEDPHLRVIPSPKCAQNPAKVTGCASQIKAVTRLAGPLAFSL